MNVNLYSTYAAMLSSSGVAYFTWSLKQNGIESYEMWWKTLKDLPQYKYLAIPIYKSVACRTNSAYGAAVSFLVTDLLMHQMLPQVGSCLFNKVSPNLFNRDQVL